MHKSNFFPARFVGHIRRVTHGLLVLLLAGYFGGMAFAATPVVLMPVPKPQFFDTAGRPLAFGCVFSYETGSSTPLATYTDYTGITQNSNPVVLTSGGFTASGSNGIWLQAGVSYRLLVKAAGGTNCASGSTQYTIDGIGGGTTTLTTNVTYSTTPVFNIQAQNQLFVITLTGNASSQPLTAVGIVPPGLVTWEIIQDNVGSHTFSWPANSVGGCTIGSTANQTTLQHFIWDGTNAIATGPCVIGNGPEIDTGTQHVTGDVNITGSAVAAFFKSQCANIASVGTIRLCKTDSINWRDQANGADYGISTDSGNRGVLSFAGGLETSGAVPDLFIGGTSASFPRLKRNGTAVNFRLGDDSADAPITVSTLGASGVFTSTSATYAAGLPEVSDPGAAAASTQRVYAKAGKGVCSEDSSSNIYCGLKNGNSFQILHATAGYSCAGDQTVCAFTLTWPTSFGDTNYWAVCNPQDPSTTSGDQSLANGGQGNLTATTIDVYAVSSGTTSKTYSSWTCIGNHN